MPVVRKLTPEEVRTLENKGKGQRKLIEEQYDAMLADYTEGDYGEAELEPNEKRLTVRNRLKAAAQRRGLSLEFNRTKGNTLRFKVRSGNDVNGTTSSQAAQATPEERDEEPVSAPKPRGRKRKSA